MDELRADLCDRCGRERAVHTPRYGWRRCERCERAAWEANAARSDLGQSVNVDSAGEDWPEPSRCYGDCCTRTTSFLVPLLDGAMASVPMWRSNLPSTFYGRMFPDTIQRNRA